MATSKLNLQKHKMLCKFKKLLEMANTRTRIIDLIYKKSRNDIVSALFIAPLYGNKKLMLFSFWFTSANVYDIILSIHLF